MRKYLLLAILISLSGILIYLLLDTPSKSTQITYTNDPEQIPQTKIITEQVKPIITPEEPKETEKEEPNEIEKPQTIINYSVPFTSQAPTGDWDDQRQQDGCEEASAIMAMSWVQGKSLSNQSALKQILSLADFEQTTYGEHRDVNLSDVKDWIFNNYFEHEGVEVRMNIQADDIINELQKGHIILLPMNGQKLGNPYFTAPGPERHMIVVRGYDPVTKEFITNDPGTRRGEGFRYSINTIMNAILVYPTGYHLPADESLSGMLVVKNKHP